MKKFGSVLLLIVLCFSLCTNALAAGFTSLTPSTQKKEEKNLLTTAEFVAVEEDGVVGVRARFDVDLDSLNTLEASYLVTFGALVARAENGFTKNNLKLTRTSAGSYSAPERAAMTTVYSTEGTHRVDGSFLTDTLDSFTLTVDLGAKTVERTESKLLILGFIILEDPEGEADARILYVSRGGSPYGTTPSYAGMLKTIYEEDGMETEEYISFVQSQVKSDVVAVSDMRVFICGEDSADDLDDGEKVIWVEYVPEYDPYSDVRYDPDKSTIRAAYIYYPLDFDPTELSTSELKEAGVVRVFCYIGAPTNNNSAPGLVCVHGGGGHAYAKYTLEAVRQGYAAIAIDTEGYMNVKGGSNYSEADASYAKDTLGHVGKDSFNNVEGSLTEQWLYYAVMDTALANSVLRSMSNVDESKVGITGISWGGLITSTAICYDYRYAFAAPVYISFHVSESWSASLAGLPDKPYADALWQDADLLAQSPVPTLIITSEFDHWASVDTAMASANDLLHGDLLIKPGLEHGQQQGASISEIYHFGYSIINEEDGFIAVVNEPTAASGRSYTLTLDIPEDITDVSATLYYRTEPFYKFVQSNRPTFESIELTVSADGTVAVEVPANACMYYISFHGMNEEAARRKRDTPYKYADKYEIGSIYSSTDLVMFS